MFSLFAKMFRSLILLLLASIVLTYAILIATDAHFYENKTNEVEMLKGIYKIYSTVIFDGDLGKSRDFVPVAEEVPRYFARSLKIMIPAFFISMIGGIILGLIHYFNREKRIGKIWRVKELFFGTIPDFFLFITVQYGIMLLIRKGFPKVDLYGDEYWYNAIFPVLVLCIAPTIYISNIIYHSLLEDEKKDFVRTALAKGTSERKIILSHLLWNSWGTVLSYSQTVMLFILTSLPVIEKLAFYKGAGNELLVSIKAGDTNLVIGFLFPFLLVMLITIWMTDIVKFFLVPVDLENELESRTISKANQFRIIKGVYYFIKEFPYKKAYETCKYGFRYYPALSTGTLLLVFLLFMAYIGPFLLSDSNLDTFHLMWKDGRPIVPPIPPGEEYFFGSDRMGRPIFSMLVLGARESLTEVIFITIIRFFISIPLGYFASIHRGANALLGFSNSILSFLPSIILIVLIGNIPAVQESFIRHGFLIFMIALLEVGRISEVFRLEFIKINKNDYMNAAISVGTNGLHLVKNYYIPNLYQKVLFIFISDLGRVMFLLGGLGIMQVYLSQLFVLDESGATYIKNLSFSWGALLAGSITDIRQAPWIAFFPAGCIAFSIITFHLFGYGLKDFLEKRAHKKRNDSFREELSTVGRTTVQQTSAQVN